MWKPCESPEAERRGLPREKRHRPGSVFRRAAGEGWNGLFFFFFTYKYHPHMLLLEH